MRITRAIKEVFQSFRYILIASIGALTAFTLAVWFPNLSLIASTASKSNVPLGIKAQLLWGLFGSITTNFSTFSAIYTIAIAILFGINLAMAIHLLMMGKLAGLGSEGLAAGFGGVASGVFGMGCAACGSFVLSSILSLVGASGAITLLPLKGGEFGILSVVLFTVSIYFVARKITTPFACSPKIN